MATKTINYDDGSIYTGEVNASGVPHGKGKRAWHGEWEGFSYEGDYVNGEWHGKGRYSYPDGGYYEGDYVHGKQTGKCKIYFGSASPFNGALYEGDIVDGQWTGRGKIAYTDGSGYEGEYLNGQWNGHGKYTSADGGYYEGEFVMGVQTGHCRVYFGGSIWAGATFEGTVENSFWGIADGTLTFPDGSFYEGAFESGHFSGDGYFGYPNGDFKDGSWHFDSSANESVFTGSALLHYENGDIFEGEIDYDQPYFGTYAYANGDIYDGPLDEDGKRGTIDDEGKMTYADGRIYNGEWSDGEWFGKGTFTDKNGDCYYCEDWNGYFSTDEDAEVTLTSDTGEKTVGKITDGVFISSVREDIYDGEKNEYGQPHGVGQMKYADGSVYDGEWKFGAWYGSGIYTDKSGDTYFGTFIGTREAPSVVKNHRERGTLKNGIFYKA